MKHVCTVYTYTHTTRAISMAVISSESSHTIIFPCTRALESAVYYNNVSAVSTLVDLGTDIPHEIILYTMYKPRILSVFLKAGVSSNILFERAGNIAWILCNWDIDLLILLFRGLTGEQQKRYLPQLTRCAKYAGNRKFLHFLKNAN